MKEERSFFSFIPHPSSLIPSLAAVGLVLLDFGEHPVELAARHLAVAVFADARGVDLQGRGAVRAVEVGARVRRPSLAVADESPVLAPAPELLVRPGDDLALGADRVVVALGPDAYRDRVVEGVLLDPDGLHPRDAELVERVPQVLPLVSLYPVLVHLENVVRLVRARALPLQGRPGQLQLVEDERDAGLELLPAELRVVLL